VLLENFMIIKILITGGSGFIGTNILQYYIDKNVRVLNIDIAQPRNIKHFQHWKKVDIRDAEALKTVFNEYSPTHVIHLAARVDLKGKKLSDYSSNIEGVENLITAINLCKTVKKTIFASSMLVCGVGHVPKNYYDYNPSTVYGASKVKTEEIIRANKDMSCAWNIVRPTSIWGPWFGEPYRNFFDIVISKRFIHPNNMSCIKTYGYVGNSVYQLDKLLFSQDNELHGKTFYIGDKPPINISEWADEILFELGQPPAKKAPLLLFKFAAIFGDILEKFNINFPMTTFRLKNMTTDNILDLDELYETVGETPYRRKEGIKETLLWLKQYEKLGQYIPIT